MRFAWNFATLLSLASGYYLSFRIIVTCCCGAALLAHSFRFDTFRQVLVLVFEFQMFDLFLNVKHQPKIITGKNISSRQKL